MYWHLTRRDGNGFRWLKGSTGERKSGCFTKVCIVSWEWGSRVRRVRNKLFATELRVDVEEQRESENLKFTPCFPGLFASWAGVALGSQRMSAGVRGGTAE